MEYFEYALQIGKVCVDLCPESFEAWNLLARCYINLQDLKMALIAMDNSPFIADIPLVEIPSFK